MRLDARVLAISDDLTAWRRHLHADPELGFNEHRTAAFIAQQLRGWGIDFEEGIGGTGIVATLKGLRGDGPTIAIRAELDALPMDEITNLPHASKVAGRMHACGHDGHMSMVLGAAKILSGSPDFAGTVRFIFQPAEEGLGGALAMLDDGLFERFDCDEIYALHNSERPLGDVAVHSDVVAAAADRFEIVIQGRGGHAATPHLTIDPLPIAARLLLDLEALPGRLTDVASPAVVTVASLHAGNAFNTIPHIATLTGTVRCLSERTRATLEDAIRLTVDAHARMKGAAAHIHYESPFAVTRNSAEQAQFVAGIAAQVVSREKVDTAPQAEMGSEDFSFMLQKRPGCYFLLGQADAAHEAAAHDPRYDFNDELLTIGTSIWVRLVESRLGGRGD